MLQTYCFLLSSLTSILCVCVCVNALYSANDTNNIIIIK